MRLVIGTTNEGKVRQMRGALQSLDLDLVPIAAVTTGLPVVEEIGGSAEAIAAKKAVEYAEFVEEAVLALDHWLFLDGLPDSAQPRDRVRRLPGRTDNSSDEEMIEYYSGLARTHGGALGATWHLGVAIARDGAVSSTTITARRTFVGSPSKTRMRGMPLSSLQIDLETGRYVSEHEAEDEIALWQRVYGPTLVQFVSRSLSTTS